MVRGVASAWGSATVVNAISTGKGAAFGVELRLKAEVELTGQVGEIRGEVPGGGSPRLIEICVKKVLKELELEKTYGAKVTTTSEVPIAAGLSSSSAAANAAVLATFAAAGEKPSLNKVLNLGIDAAFEAGVTITGALDDAAASLFGKGMVTDNLRRRILKQFKVDPKLKVIIYIPPSKSYTAKIPVAKLKPISRFAEIAHQQAFLGNIFGAMTLNGLIHSTALGYDAGIALDAIKSGALASGLSGTGPAVVAIAGGNACEVIRERWGKLPGKVVVTKAAQEPAKTEAG